VTQVVEGQILAGKYRVERVLGIGGMGVVVAALHLQLDERVAIKFMLPEAFASAEAIARFSREARAAVKIKSEHVARVLDVGVLESGAPYMVMEYLDGSDLSAWLEQHTRLSIEQSVEFVLQAGEAIAEAHSLGIVHRDLKPANLFVVRRPSGGFAVKVLDFGISKVTRSGAPDFGVTKSSATMGSPLYMAPELISDAREADARCDIWALGVILYELICGVTPFQAETLFNVMLQIARSAPPPMRTHVSNVPQGLETAIMTCLEKDPNRRFANVALLAAALADFAPPRARVSFERISGVLGPAEGATTQLESVVPARLIASNVVSNPSSASWGHTSPARAPNRRALIGVVIAGVVVVALGGATVLSLQSSKRLAKTAASSEAKSGSEQSPTLVPASARTSAALPALSASSASAPAAVTALDAPPSASATSSASSVSSVSQLAPAAPKPKNPPRNAPLAPANPRSVYDDRK